MSQQQPNDSQMTRDKAWAAAKLKWVLGVVAAEFERLAAELRQ